MADKIQARVPLISSKPFLAIVGVLMYATLNWLSTIFPLAAGDVNIRPGVVVPIFGGLFFGPFVGFVSGLGGNLLGDILSGVIAFPVAPITENAWVNFAMGTFLPWQIGNGLMGLVPGFSKRYAADYNRVSVYFHALGFALLGIVVGMGFASIATVWLGVLTAQFVFTQYFLPATWSNIYNTLFLLPIMIFNYVHFDMETFGVFRSTYMRRFLILLLSAAVLPTLILGLVLIQPDLNQNGESASTIYYQGTLLIKLIFTIVTTMLFVLVNASLLAQRMSRLLLRVSGASHLMEKDELTLTQAKELMKTSGNDEISQLCRTFGAMAKETLVREEKMRREIRQLHIQIDHNKTAREVAAITETEYFQQLEEKAARLRGLNLSAGVHLD